jgi:uncharacterized membrane protein
MPQTKTPTRFFGVWVTVLIMGLVSTGFSFLLTVRDYAALPEADGFVPVIGVPVGVFTLAFGVVALVAAAAFLARGRAASALANRAGSASRSSSSSPAERMLGWFLLVAGAIGWYAAFALAADKVQLLVEPASDLACNVSLLVQCGANLESWQGSIFGFPNPLIGIAGWAAVFTVGCLVLAGIRLPRWFWIGLSVGVTGAFVFVAWLIGQSIFVLGTLCPWCMVTWAVTIPLFWAVTLHGASKGTFGATTRRTIGPAFGWVPLITVGSYLLVAVIAQLRLDVLSYL